MAKRKEETAARWRRNEGETKPPKKTSGAQPGNTNAMDHGIFADRCLDEEERIIFRKIIERIYHDFIFNSSSDFLQVEMVGINFVKMFRAQQEGNKDAAETYDRMIRANMKDLKTTKISREGEKPKADIGDPASWAAKVLAKNEEAAERKGKRGRPKKKKTAKAGSARRQSGQGK